MLSRVIVNTIRRSVWHNARILCCPRELLHSDFSLCNSDIKSQSVQNHCNLYIAKRFKSRKKTADTKKSKDEDSDEEKEENSDDENEAPPGSKVIKIKVSSLRLDTIVKVGLKMSRSKVEEAFYNSRFHINGNKVLKKSKEVEIGDEIDIVLHQNVNNPSMLFVNRIVILSIDPASGGAQIKLSLDKNLLIENYEDSYGDL
ncbi:uncharacterized protein LOC105205821 [Solenopsis invicta]|uniref:uncharacterized protein LOC105205821 n=1 Tax=Solenopsis invicta TaxID=13686 RepID=UPI0001FEA584|nr:uncharacterized protein LOC105205821 [Solenopsis invicta]